MTNSPADKKKVFRGIATAWGLSATFIGLGYFLSQTNNWFSDISPLEVLSLTFLPPAIALAAGIGWAARTRHFAQNIDGSAPQPGTSLDITLRYITNTSEQILLFIIMAICLSGAAPKLAQSILPVLGVWFFIARLLFWAGYKRAPTSRAVGFASTFHPTLVFLFLSAAALISKMI